MHRNRRGTTLGKRSFPALADFDKGDKLDIIAAKTRHCQEPARTTASMDGRVVFATRQNSQKALISLFMRQQWVDRK